MIKLFFNKYEDPIEFRNDELIMCEASNRANPFIHEVHALEGRPTFREMFEYINLHSEPGDICIICNSDIFMDETLEAIYEIQPDEVFALSRYDMQEDGSLVLFDREDSQDTWAFVSPVRDVPDCDFTLGKSGNDNAIAERFARCGYTVKNPSLTIRTIHLHLSGVRRHGWRNPVKPPYLMVPPTEIYD